MAGAAGVLASMVQADASQVERDRAIRTGNLWGLSPGGRVLRGLVDLSANLRLMKRFVGDHFFAPEIAGVVGGVIVGVTQASTGAAYAIALLLLVAVLAIGFSRERRAPTQRMR
jgi:hypothetical protein